MTDAGTLRFPTIAAIALLTAIFTGQFWEHEVEGRLIAANGIAALLCLMPWPSTAAMRALRLLGGILLAVTGTLFTVEFGIVVEHATLERDGGSLTALLVALFVGVVGTFGADLSIGHRADAEARQRHEEVLEGQRRHLMVLERLEGVHPPGTQRTADRVRLRDLALLAIAAHLVSRGDEASTGHR